MEKSGKLIALNIRKLRAILNMTQSELAEKANLSLRGIQAIETQGRAPRAETLEQIAKALGVPVGELYLNPNQKKSTGLPTITPDRAAKILALQFRLMNLSDDDLNTVEMTVQNLEILNKLKK